MTILQESVFDETSATKKNIIDVPAGTVFYNAPKTAGDKITLIKHDVDGNTEYNEYNEGFLSFWTEMTGIEAPDIGFLCANRDCPYGENIEAYNLQGGHVVGKPKDKMQDGDRFCILPLCPKCNNSSNRVAMKLRYDVKSPVLTWKEE